LFHLVLFALEEIDLSMKYYLGKFTSMTNPGNEATAKTKKNKVK